MEICCQLLMDFRYHFRLIFNTVFSRHDFENSVRLTSDWLKPKLVNKLVCQPGALTNSVEKRNSKDELHVIASQNGGSSIGVPQRGVLQGPINRIGESRYQSPLQSAFGCASKYENQWDERCCTDYIQIKLDVNWNSHFFELLMTFKSNKVNGKMIVFYNLNTTM